MITSISWNSHQIKEKKHLSHDWKHLFQETYVLIIFQQDCIFHLGFHMSVWTNFPQASFGLYVSDLVYLPLPYSSCIAAQPLPTPLCHNVRWVGTVHGRSILETISKPEWLAVTSLYMKPTENHITMSHWAEINVRVSNPTSPWILKVPQLHHR